MKTLTREVQNLIEINKMTPSKVRNLISLKKMVDRMVTKPYISAEEVSELKAKYGEEPDSQCRRI